MDRRYSTHALEEMAEHGVADSDVAAVLAAPRHRRPSYAHREEVYGEAADGRTLKVVVVEGSRPATVITVMPFSRRRLRRLMNREGSRWLA